MLTITQLCGWLNITERHARKLVERDAIPYRKVGRLLRFFEPDVESWTRPAQRAEQAKTASRPSGSTAIPNQRRTSHARIPRSVLSSSRKDDHIK